jgi:hypothetical protein
MPVVGIEYGDKAPQNKGKDRQIEGGFDYQTLAVYTGLDQPHEEEKYHPNLDDDRLWQIGKIVNALDERQGGNKGNENKAPMGYPIKD